MAGNAAENLDVERRGYRRVSDAVGLQFCRVDTDNEQSIDQLEAPQHPTHVVSLSPNGLRCYHEEALENGEQMQLRLVLFPENLILEFNGKVVNAGEDKGSTRTNRYFAGIAFVDVSDEQSKQLLDHIDNVAKKSFGGAVKLVNAK